jgi:hypothetical protein
LILKERFLVMKALLVLRSRSLLGIATNNIGTSMNLLSMNAKPRLLLECLLAAIDAALVWIIFGMGIDVLHNVLALREAAAAYYAFEALHALVDIDEVSLQAVQGGEGAIAVVVQAFDPLGLEILTFQHGLELVLDLAFGISGQFEANCEALHVILFDLVITVLVL